MGKIMKKIVAVVLMLMLFIGTTCLSEVNTENFHLSCQLECGAMIDADVDLPASAALPCYEVEGISVDDALLMSVFSDSSGVLLTEDFAHFFRWVSDVEWRLNADGEADYDVIVCTSSPTGQVLYRDTEFIDTKVLILDCAELACGMLGEGLFSHVCSFAGVDEVTSQVIGDLKSLCGDVDYELVLYKGLTVSDIISWQKFLSGNQTMKEAYSLYGYRWIETPGESDEAYLLVLGMYMNGIPMHMWYDTRNYLEGVLTTNFLKNDCMAYMDARGYGYATFQYLPKILSQTEPQQLLSLDEAIKLFESFADNDGDYIYPDTIRHIYLEYIWIVPEWSENNRGYLRPYWCFSEEACYDADPQNHRGSFSAYRFDAVTGAFLDSVSAPLN